MYDLTVDFFFQPAARTGVSKGVSRVVSRVFTTDVVLVLMVLRNVPEGAAGPSVIHGRVVVYISRVTDDVLRLVQMSRHPLSSIHYFYE